MKLPNDVKCIDIVHNESIPPISSLIEWRAKIRKEETRTTANYAMLSNGQYYDLETVIDAIALYEAGETKKEVKKEIDWFNTESLKPNVATFPSSKNLAQFRSVIFEKASLELIDKYDMPCEELSRICCTKLLSDDHILWFVRQLNMQQSSCFCIFMNPISDISSFVSSQIKNTPTKLCFVINVGIDKKGVTYIGNENGTHWVLCTYDSEKHSMDYGDSLGWPMPKQLPNIISEYVFHTFGRRDPPSVVFMHDPSNNRKCTHQCGASCTIYPSQVCFNVCGVVVTVVMAIFCLGMEFYDRLSRTKHTSMNKTYLSQPTKYSKYLRQCLIHWMVEGHIDISCVIPVEQTVSAENPVPLQSDVASDDDVDFSVTPSIKNKGSKKECHVCHQLFTTVFNLKRHIMKKHGEEELGAADKGNCPCLSCDRKFRKIADLRKHLVTSHNMIFRTESLDFDSSKGKHVVQYQSKLFFL